jgi:catechol 2,3-dioxygenase-like lactoylglutathione lyase family enzyme
MDMSLEVVVLPVSDVDGANDFYKALGWRLDADFVGSTDFRVVQLTPPGSSCSVIFGTGITSAAPGSAQGLNLVVDDIGAARTELADRGAQVSEVFHDAGGCSTTLGHRSGYPARHRTIKATARLPRSATRTAMNGLSRKSLPAFRAGEGPGFDHAGPPVCPGQATEQPKSRKSMS